MLTFGYLCMVFAYIMCYISRKDLEEEVSRLKVEIARLEEQRK